MAVKRGLGRGLNALFKDGPVTSQPTPTPAAAAAPSVLQIALDQISDNPFQPRQKIAPEALAGLVQSIRTHGVLEPLLVRRVGDQFELIAGERRLRAAQQAGLSTVPALLKEAVSDKEALELALIENLQREDLNAIEEAQGYQQLAEKFALNQDQIAARVGKARTTVTNALRLLSLPAEIKQLVAEGKLSGGHARALLGVVIDEEKIIMARRAILEGWSVRLLERAVARLSRVPRKPRAARVDIPASHLQFISDKLHRHFGTSVRIFPPKTLANGKQVKGALEIDFYTSDDLSRILELLGLADEG